MKLAALLYLLVYYGILLVFRSYILFKNTGINPVKNMDKNGIQGFIENIMTACFISISVIVLNFVFLENNYQWFIPIHYLENIEIGYAGIAISFFGLIIGIIAQLQMGNSWRLGLDKNSKTKLVIKGFFKYSRNPIYLGIIISNIGFFMMMPNALSFAFLIVSYIGLEIKIRLEENFLKKLHSVEYIKYKSSVRRWI